MILMRIEMTEPAYPDGRIDHGHVDVMVKETDSANYDQEREMASDVLNSWQLKCWNPSGDSTLLDIICFEIEHKDDDFDKGSVYAIVVDGEGEALSQNPIGEQFTKDI